MRVDDLAQIPLAYPTYGAILARAAVMAAGQLGLSVGWQANQLDGAQAVAPRSGSGTEVKARQLETTNR